MTAVLYVVGCTLAYLTACCAIGRFLAFGSRHDR